MAALRVSPPINRIRFNGRCAFSSSALTLPAMMSCSVCRTSSGVASFRLSLWVMSDLQCTEQRAACSHGNDLSPDRSPDGFLHSQSHPPNLLHEEFTRASRAFVVREHVPDLSVCNQIDQERFAPERNHRVKVSGYLGQGSLNGGYFEDMPQKTGNTEEIRVKEFGFCQEFGEHRSNSSVMGSNP